MKRSAMPPRTTPMPRSDVPWARTVPFQSGRPPEAEVKSAATKKGSNSGKLTPDAPAEFTRKVKHLVRTRAGRGDVFEAQCEACGAWLGHDTGEFQHRAARGAGGCRDAVINGPANCVLLCGSGALRTGCHGACEDRMPHLAMDAEGFWLEHGTTPEYDPRNVAIALHGQGSGITVYLAEDGLGPDGTGYLLQAPEVRAA